MVSRRCAGFKKTYKNKKLISLSLDIYSRSICLILVANLHSETFMQQFHSQIGSSQNSASRFWMNLILFHQAQNSDKKIGRSKTAAEEGWTQPIFGEAH